MPEGAFQGRSQDFTLPATEAERRRRENRGTKGAERGWEGCLPPQPHTSHPLSTSTPRLELSDLHRIISYIYASLFRPIRQHNKKTR